MEFEEKRPGRSGTVAERNQSHPPEGRKRRPSVYGFVLCLLLLAAGAALLYRDMDRTCRHGIYRCEGGRMLEMPVPPDSYKTAETAAGIAALAEKHPEIDQYMMLIPSSGYVQRRFLPESAPLRDQTEDLRQIRTGMPSVLHWVDLTEVFSGHEGEKLYYATDPHLTGWGSRYAARAALESMEAETAEGKDECYLLSDSFEGRLAQDDTLIHRLLDRKTERIEIYVPEKEVPYYRVDGTSGAWSGSLYDASAAEGKDPLKVFFGGERPLTEIHTAAVNGRTLLVAGDTMANTIVPMFVSSFEKIVFVHPSECPARMEKLIKKYQPTGILYIYGVNGFMQDRALLHTLGR